MPGLVRGSRRGGYGEQVCKKTDGPGEKEKQKVQGDSNFHRGGPNRGGRKVKQGAETGRQGVWGMQIRWSKTKRNLKKEPRT